MHMRIDTMKVASDCRETVTTLVQRVFSMETVETPLDPPLLAHTKWHIVFIQLDHFQHYICNTVEPLYKGHHRGMKFWPL